MNPFDATTTSITTRPRKYADQFADRPSAAAYDYYADPDYWDQATPSKASALRDLAEAQAISMSAMSNR